MENVNNVYKRNFQNECVVDMLNKDSQLTEIQSKVASI